MFSAIDGKEFEIAFNLCFQCCDPPLGNHLFLVEQCTWSHPVMAHHFPHCSVKFIYSEKATIFCEIFPLLLIVCAVVKGKGKISQIKSLGVLQTKTCH